MEVLVDEVVDLDLEELLVVVDFKELVVDEELVVDFFALDEELVVDFFDLDLDDQRLAELIEVLTDVVDFEEDVV